MQKKKHGMRYTQYRGLAQVTNWVKLKFAAMKKKKNWPLEMETGKIFLRGRGGEGFFYTIIFLAAIFSFFQTKKPALA